MNKNEMNSKPRRAQGGKGLLSRSIHVQSLHKSMAKILTPREEKGGREEGAWERSNYSVLAPGAKGKRERVGRERDIYPPLTLD